MSSIIEVENLTEKIGEGARMQGGHAFSVEMDIVKLNEAEDRLLIQGFLGELEEMRFIEHVMLEIKGVEGILRIGLKEEELRKLLRRGMYENAGSSG